MLIQSAHKQAARCRFEPYPIDSAAPFIYLTRLWLAFAEITAEYLRMGSVQLRISTLARAIESTTNAHDDDCEVIDLAARRAEHRRLGRHQEWDR